MKALLCSQLDVFSKEMKACGYKIIDTSGCFDIIHVGHVKLFEFCKGLGGVVVVGVNGDRRVRELKGDGHPINPIRARLEVVSAMQNVDYVYIFDEDTPCNALERLKPDVHVKGGDWSQEDLEQTEVVQRNGGAIVIFNTHKGYSTSDIIRKVKLCELKS